ncbi:hypothetical protein LCGC14_2280330 [marine sediment metagenome]|uniref:Aspartate/glutamate/uridylate kinase domain-containing protein n=1 Tax=marine sediment metagenome TaxID=412755 RepID=A0A0F9CUT5_9ZZZZ
MEALNKELKVMDSTAVSLAMDNDLPIVVFNVNKSDNIKQVARGEEIGTIMEAGKE